MAAAPCLVMGGGPALKGVETRARGVCVCVCVTPKSFKSCSNCEVPQLRPTTKRLNRVYVCVGGGGGAPYYRGRPVWVCRWVREAGPCDSGNDTRGVCTGASVYATLT